MRAKNLQIADTRTGPPFRPFKRHNSREHSEEEGQLNLGVRWFHIFGSSIVGYSEFSGYPYSAYTFLAVT